MLLPVASGVLEIRYANGVVQFKAAAGDERNADSDSSTSGYQATIFKIGQFLKVLGDKSCPNVTFGYFENLTFK